MNIFMRSKHFKIITNLLLLSIITKAQTNTFPVSGNVGIGTIAPEERLDVYGGDNELTSIFQIRAHKNDYGNVRARFNVYSTGSSLTDRLTMGVDNNATAITILANGNIGINNETPKFGLDVKGTTGLSTIGMRIWNSNPSWSAESLIRTYTDWESNSYPAVDFGFYRGSGSGGEGSSGFIVKTGTVALTSTKFIINQSGNVGIGTMTPSEKLSVNGNISSKKSIVTQVGWSDYVFNEDYVLKPLDEIAKYVKENKHLPEIPSAKEVEQKGLDLGDSQALLLKKIEELTLYLIAQEEKNKRQDARIQELEQRLKGL